MKYYTLSFKNKILLALIFVFIICLGAVCGTTFLDHNTITADAKANFEEENLAGDGGGSSVAYTGFTGSDASEVPSKVTTAYDWIQTSGEESYHEIVSVTLVKI